MDVEVKMDGSDDEEMNPMLLDYNYSINDLPDEVLEYILSLLPPYKELEKCTEVCKRWKKSVISVIHHRNYRMFHSLVNFDVKWECVLPPEKFQSITKRYSHSACFHDNYMYVFGGCTCTSTTFNDLWKLDLSTRQWSRLLTMGAYPSPKACATLLYHDGALILFGGWTHPSPYPLHQAWKTFSELHMYDIETNCWCSITTPINTPPPMAGHSATVHGEDMVVFGGLNGLSGSSNDVWCFNLYMQTWRKPTITGVRPQPRYGQSQIFLDENHLLILGGCGGGNMNLNDIWLLNMADPVWTWRQVSVRNPQWAASHLWCHPACKIGQFVVVFSRNPVSVSPMFTYSKWRPQVHSVSQSSIPDRDSTIPVAVRRASESVVEQPSIDRDVNINGRRGSLSVRIAQQSVREDCGAASSILSGQENTNASSKLLRSLSDVTSLCKVNSLVEEPLNSPQTSSVSLSSNLRNAEGPSTNQRDSPTNSTVSGALRTGNNCDNIFSRNNNRMNSVDVCDRSALDSDRFVNNLALHNRRLENLGRDIPSLSDSGLAAFKDVSGVKHISRQRERQLEALRRVEERLRTKNMERLPESVSRSAPASSSTSGSSSPPSTPSKRDMIQPQLSTTAKTLTPKMAMFVLDVSTVLSEECFVTWLPIRSIAEDSPDDMILYSLVAGNAELIMFGGIQKDAMSINQQAQSSINISNIVSNSLYFISPPRTVI